MRTATWLFVMAFLVACEPAARPAAQAPGPPPAPPVATAPAPSASSSVPPAPTAYAGHGASSVPAEVLAKYAPPRLDAAVSRKIQAMLDVRAPGPGAVSPDGKQMYFTWTITGTRQVWRLDGPRRFPVQLTGGEDATSFTDITPDGKRILVSRDRKGEENPGLYVLDPKGGSLTVIEHKPRVQTFYEFTSDDSRYVYFRSNDVKQDSYAIYRYDLATRERELVFGEQGIWSVADY